MPGCKRPGADVHERSFAVLPSPRYYGNSPLCNVTFVHLAQQHHNWRVILPNCHSGFSHHKIRIFRLKHFSKFDILLKRRVREPTNTTIKRSVRRSLMLTVRHHIILIIWQPLKPESPPLAILKYSSKVRVIYAYHANMKLHQLKKFDTLFCPRGETLLIFWCAFINYLVVPFT